MTERNDNHSPDRSNLPTLSSTVRSFGMSGLMAIALGSSSLATAQVQQTEPNLDAAPLPATTPTTIQPMTQPLARVDDSLPAAISQWRMLESSDNYSFTAYASFLIAHPGWPSEGNMRKNAERMMRADGEPSRQVIAFFNRYPAVSATAQLRYAEALAAEGRSAEAREAVRLAWTKGALTPEDEARFLSRFGGALQPGDHDARMNRLLWDRSTLAAARQLPWTSPSQRAVFDARLAMLSKSADAASKAAAVYPAARNDAGYLADRNWWQRNTAQLFASRETLAASRSLTAPPLDPQRWLDSLFVTAKAANNDNQFDRVFNIARQVNDAYTPGTVVSDRPFGERDTYTNLTWMGAQAALTKLGRARDAIGLFQLYAGAAKSAQTKAKGLYWAGRAAESSGQRELARTYYESAGQYFDQFHGQLALERMGLPVTPPTMRRTVEISGAQRIAFENSSLVKAARILGAQGAWMDQSKFVRAIAAKVDTDVDATLANELAAKINRPDLAVMVGRNARTSGLGDYIKTAFPQVSVPSEHTSSWTMIHAIARQESQFDRQIISKAGARGLMQLMPGTARETAPRAGVSYSLPALFEPTTNIRLGSTYFSQLMDRYGGNYVLSVAAYNAGPGNVNRWLASNGDPRVPGTDVLAWIERIPLSETRNYVQRVLENAVVYDILNPGRANIRSRTPLSAYLGKSQPG